MIPQQRIPTHFTPLQQELFKLFSVSKSEEDLVAIKQLVSNYYMDKLQKKVDKAVEELGYTQEDFDAWLNDPNQ